MQRCCVLCCSCCIPRTMSWRWCFMAQQVRRPTHRSSVLKQHSRPTLCQQHAAQAHTRRSTACTSALQTPLSLLRKDLCFCRRKTVILAAPVTPQAPSHHHHLLLCPPKSQRPTMRSIGRWLLMGSRSSTSTSMSCSHSCAPALRHSKPSTHSHVGRQAGRGVRQSPDCQPGTGQHSTGAGGAAVSFWLAG